VVALLALSARVAAALEPPLRLTAPPAPHAP